VRVPPYRLGFAVKVVGDGGLAGADTRRWQSGPHLSRSLELLDAVFRYLDRNDIRMYRMSSGVVPYGTHPDLPQFDHRRQIAECAGGLAELGARARAQGLRLSTHPGQYTVMNAPDPEIARKSMLDLEQDAALLDAMGLGPEAVIVIHVGGVYGEREAAMDRWVRTWEAVSDRVRARLVLEHDETSYHLGHVLEIHRRTGVRVVFDLHHHRCFPAPGLEDPAEALAAAYATWPRDVRPKAHLSSPRTELRTLKRKVPGERKLKEVLVPPALDQHADFVTPFDLVELIRAAPGPLDVMLEAKAKDLALLWLRTQLQRVSPAVAAAEERRDTAVGEPDDPLAVEPATVGD
jgi:UV DNA damage endonuclease